MVRSFATAALGAALALFAAPPAALAEAPPPPKPQLTVLHSFALPPTSGLTLGPDDALYGASNTQIFRLFQDDARVWRVQTVYTFASHVEIPQLTWRGRQLYGVSTFGGEPCVGGPGCGFVFRLTPPREPGDAWTQRTLYSFTTVKSGRYPVGFAFGAGDEIIVTTREGGGSPNCGAAGDDPNGCGTVLGFRETRDGDALDPFFTYRFDGGQTSRTPFRRPVVSGKRTIYLTTYGGSSSIAGNCGGTFGLPRKNNTYKLSKRLFAANCTDNKGRYSQAVPHLHRGAAADAPLTMLTSSTEGGRLSTCQDVGSQGCGVVYALTEPKDQGFPWSYRQVHAFNGKDGANPVGGYTGLGNTLYGMTRDGGVKCPSSAFTGCGAIYSIGLDDDRFRYGGTVYRFQGGTTDGAAPVGDVAAYRGRLFGTTRLGGASGSGVIYMLEP